MSAHSDADSTLSTSSGSVRSLSGRRVSSVAKGAGGGLEEGRSLRGGRGDPRDMPGSESSGAWPLGAVDGPEPLRHQHEVDAVARRELVEQVGDVRLDGGFADLQ